MIPVRRPVIVLALLLCVACAREGPPEGGPIDKTPPTVRSTEPKAGAVSVPVTAAITIQFSKPVERGTLLPNFTISPPRQGLPRLDWSDGGRRVHLTWRDSLRTDATYRVSVGMRLTDIRNNPLKEPFTFAFSTGDRIDLGHIVGRVYTDQEKLGALDILAYRTDGLPDTFWMAPADYLTQSAQQGFFDLPFVKPGRYRLLAIADANRNHRLDPGEWFGMPVRDAQTADSQVSDTMRIFVSLYDTSGFHMVACTGAPEGGLSVAFSSPADTSAWAAARFRVRDSLSGDSVPVIPLAPTIRKPTVALLLVDGLQDGRRYVVGASGIRDLGGRTIPGVDSCFLTFRKSADTTGPRVEWTHLPSPREAITPRDAVVWLFSGPIDTTFLREGIRVTDTTGAMISGDVACPDLRSARFVPKNAWPESTKVIVTMDSTLLRDRAGHQAKVGGLRWVFAPLTPSAMGTLEGRVEVSDSTWRHKPCRIELRAAGAEARVSQTISAPGAFSFELPAGRWLIGAYLDLDRNGRWTPGAVRPFSLPEPRLVRDDTLTVRARFTLEDVLLKF